MQESDAGEQMNRNLIRFSALKVSHNFIMSLTSIRGLLIEVLNSP